MRPSFRSLQQVALQTSRARSTSFIGLGQMGREMAFNLFSKKLSVETQTPRFVVCDAIPEAAHAFCDNLRTQFTGVSITVAQTPAEAAMQSETVITMLPSSPHVRQVYAEAGNGIIPALRSLSPKEAQSTLCIDSTTLDVEVAREVAAEVKQSGAQMVDAPVSGGVVGAKAGTLSFLVGGDEVAFELAKPILAHMGARITHCGTVGAGLSAKICNNMVLGVQQIAVAEGMLLGEKLGLKPDVLASVINSSTGACWSSSVNNPVAGALPGKSPPCERNFEGGFATALMLKDMGLASNLARIHSLHAPLGTHATEVYEKVVEGRPDLIRKDFSSVYVFLEERSRKL